MTSGALRKIIPLAKDRKIRWLRYLVLIFFTIGAWLGGRLLIRPYDPWVSWMHLSEPQHVLAEFPVSAVLLRLIRLQWRKPRLRNVSPVASVWKNAGNRIPWFSGLVKSGLRP